MLCSLCQHGVTAKIGGKPTGATWECPCGQTHCRHVERCPNCDCIRTTLADVLFHLVYREQTNGEWQEIYRSEKPEEAAKEAERMTNKGRIRTKVVPRIIRL